MDFVKLYTTHLEVKSCFRVGYGKVFYKSFILWNAVTKDLAFFPDEVEILRLLPQDKYNFCLVAVILFKVGPHKRPIYSSYRDDP
jgi:hypothetical protein